MTQIGLLRSPPYTGKSSLGIRLVGYLTKLGYQALYIPLAGLSQEAMQSSQQFNQYWRQQVLISWDSLRETRYDRAQPDSCPTRLGTYANFFSCLTYVIVDEAQVIYGSAPFFWGALKNIQLTQSKSNLHVLLLSMYDITNIAMLPTPLDFPNALGLDALRIGYEDLQEVVSRFVAIRRDREHNTKFSVPLEVQQAIYNLSAGHVGMCRIALLSLVHCFKDGSTAIEMLRYLTSPEFRHSLCNTRVLSWIQKWKPNDKETSLLRDLMYICDQESAVRLDVISRPESKRFFKCGLLVSMKGKVYFVAPFMRIVLGHFLFTVPGGDIHAPVSFDEFVLRIIERMDSRQLRNSIGVGRDQQSALLERQWQMEWYWSATGACPIGATVSVDVGAVFGPVGFLDFYVNGDLCWGVELMREGVKLRQHAQRFEDDGIYANIPLKDWAILDFRRESKAVVQVKPKFWHVCYADDYTKVTVKRHGWPDKVLNLRAADNSMC